MKRRWKWTKWIQFINFNNRENSYKSRNAYIIFFLKYTWNESGKKSRSFDLKRKSSDLRGNTPIRGEKLWSCMLGKGLVLHKFGPENERLTSGERLCWWKGRALWVKKKGREEERGEGRREERRQREGFQRNKRSKGEESRGRR